MRLAVIAGALSDRQAARHYARVAHKALMSGFSWLLSVQREECLSWELSLASLYAITSLRLLRFLVCSAFLGEVANFVLSMAVWFAMER